MVGYSGLGLPGRRPLPKESSDYGAGPEPLIEFDSEWKFEWQSLGRNFERLPVTRDADRVGRWVYIIGRRSTPSILPRQGMGGRLSGAIGQPVGSLQLRDRIPRPHDQ